ncbi:MAG: hypothetical protein JSW34_11180 [Candidatus Zixiibacteriota bacterium]|nr:MAG: hypothetical protein JSW34_11180 [candidate division Zixibacteria bacterium]
MFKRNKLLFLLILALLSSCLYWGCEQPEDILTPLSKTNIWLQEEKLPANPPGMVYELWVAGSSDTLSLGKFGYDQILHRYLETDGSVRSDSNEFFAAYDAMSYTDMLVSVERFPDDNTNSPGAIMLMGSLSDQTVRLRFPQIDSLWGATAWYNMESPSDGLDSVTDGYAVWFATYTEQTRPMNDTNAIVEWWVDTLIDTEHESGDTVIVTTGLDPASILVKDTGRIFGLDTVYHSVVRFDLVRDTLTDEPYFNTSLSIVYDVTVGSVIFDEFNQGETEEHPEGEFLMPLLIDYGWKYKGWIVSPQIDSNIVANRMTMPAWRQLDPWLDECEGAVLTTGTFADARCADDANPYVASTRVPQYPGEDFLMNLPGNHPPVNFVPSRTGNPGRVFISLEPINSVTDTTNFPLIPFVGELPYSRTEVTDSDAVQQFVLRGWMMQESDTDHGFPWMGVTMKRF